MKYHLWLYAGGALVAAAGFVFALQSVVIFALAFCGGLLFVQVLTCLRGYLPAAMTGEKPPFAQNFPTLLAYLTQLLAAVALATKFGFWEVNPSAMRMAVFLFVPTLLILLVQMRIAAAEGVLAHFRQLFISVLVTLAVTFMFFLTPEKRLAERFLKDSPALQKTLLEIEKRAPKRVLRLKQDTLQKP